MGKRRRQTSRKRASTSASSSTELDLGPLLTTLVWSLFFARWLVPTEASAEGESLWLTSLTLAAAAVWFWWQSKRHLVRLKPGLTDAVVWCLAGAHIFSAILVLAGEGEKRLAINMLWEWFSLAVLVSTLRQTLLCQAARQRFLQTLVTLGIVLSLFGIWQHYFWYGSNLREYEALRNELDKLESASTLNAADARRLRELKSQFLQDGIPLNERQRGLFERRLRDSSEPLGFFALANSFAGILSVVVVLLVAGLLKSISETIPSHLTQDSSAEPNAPPVITAPRLIGNWLKMNCLPVGCLAVVGFTLLLTKSRTAFIAAAAGIGFATLMTLAGLNRDALKRIVIVAVLAILLAGILTGGAIATGSLDVEVLSEAPKSIQYRFLYWSGTSQVIAESPWFGVGPGNFRSHYLQHKLPETSEEIADPHNLLFDVAANAGLPGTLALLLLVTMLIRNALRFVKAQKNLPALELEQPAADAGSPATVLGAAVAIAFGWQFIVEASFNLQLMMTGLIAVALSLTARRLQSSKQSIPGADLPATAALAAVVALLVHLLAAGGIAMPAICGCLLALTILTEPPRLSEPSSEAASRTQIGALVVAAGLATAFAGCLQTALVPVIRATSEIRSGDFEATRQFNYSRARARYAQAALADPLSPVPLMRLSDVLFRFWEQTKDDDRFDQSVDFALEAQKRNPYSGFYAYQIGRRFRQRFHRTRNDEHAQSAAEWLGKAIHLYPTQPMWNAEYAIALNEAGRSARAATAARKTLELEKINQDAGHIDRFLPEAILLDVRELVRVR